MSIYLTLLLTAMSGIKTDETVVFYNTTACRTEDGTAWQLPIHGSIYELEEDSAKRALLIGTIRRVMDLEPGSSESDIFARRLRYFLVDNERRKDLAIRIGKSEVSMGRSGANGHFHGEVQLPADEADELPGGTVAEGRWLRFELAMPEGDPREFAGHVQLIDERGLSLISDIDDTIKITEVHDRRAMLANTFLREFKPVPGMAEIYRQAAAAGAAVHYVSGSPWQLYLPLSQYCRQEGFPRGSFHLKYFRLKDSTAANLVTSQVATKTKAIGSIMAAYPGRRFILIGDSGEQDPEIYSAIAKGQGEKVVAIFIRNVTDDEPEGERFIKAFGSLQNVEWKVFRDADEIRTSMRRLAQEHARQ